jgi:polyphosphate kinase
MKKHYLERKIEPYTMADDKYLFLNRDLSWLSFNHRVLLEAADPNVPLYNRISFLSIFSSNLDEFFRVRMPSIFAFSAIEGKKIGIRDEYPKGLVQQVQAMVYNQLEEFGAVLTGQIIPGLQQNHIFLYYNEPIREEHLETVREYFLSKVLSFLQPVLLQKENQGTVFLENNALYFVADLEPAEQPGKHQYALLNIPSGNLPRFSELPMLGDDYYLLFLDDVIRENLAELFPGFIIHGPETDPGCRNEYRG